MNTKTLAVALALLTSSLLVLDCDAQQTTEEVAPGTSNSAVPLTTQQTGNPAGRRGFSITKGWEATVGFELGFRSTLIVEPGDKDSASLFGEFVFQIPHEFVDLKKLGIGLLESMRIEVDESLPVEPLRHIYQRSLMAREKGKEQLFRLELVSLQEPTQQRVLFMGAIPEKFDAMGGRSAMLKVFANGKSLEELTRESRHRHELLYNLPDNQVVATSTAGVELTQAQFRVGVDVAEFMAGRKLLGSDIQLLLKTVEREWEKDPDIDGINSVQNFLKQARNANPVKRLELATSLYRETLNHEKKESDKSELLKTVQRLNPVLAEKSGDILTQRALEARLNSAKIVMQLQGKGSDEIASVIPALRRQIVDSFVELPESKRKALQIAESRNFRLLTVLSSLPSKSRKQKLAKAKLSADSSHSVPELAHALEDVVTREANSQERFFKTIEQIIYSSTVLPELRNR